MGAYETTVKQIDEELIKIREQVFFIRGMSET